jgi:periplasmic divalent cation tolerance protein
MESTDVRLALSTFPDESSAECVVRKLLEERLIACGSIISGVRSLYLWQGKIEGAGENLVLFKTVEEQSLRFMERLKELHPYEVPEIILLEPGAVLPAYEGWIKDSLRNPAEAVR